jgi:hypothetical protein
MLGTIDNSTGLAGVIIKISKRVQVLLCIEILPLLGR